MISAIVLGALLQLQTVTFTHVGANSEVLLKALGEEIGQDLRPSGSVREDYFLVRFTDVPVQDALDRIADALNAKWQTRNGVQYLNRDSSAERMEVQQSVKMIQDEIRKWASKVQRLPMNLNYAREFVTRANGVAAENNDRRNMLRELNSYSAAQLFLYIAAVNVPLEPFLEDDARSYFIFDKPNWLGQRWPKDFDNMKSVMIKEQINVQQAFDELASPELIKTRIQPEFQIAPSLTDQYAIQVQMFSHAPVLSLWRREDDNNRGRAMAFIVDEEQLASVPESVAALKTKWSPTADERRLMEIIAATRSRTEDLSEEDLEFIKGVFDTENGDPLARFASSQFFLLADTMKVDIVAVLPDNLILQSVSWLDPDNLDVTRIITNLYWAGLKLIYDPTTDLLTAKPIHPTIVRRDRFDRKTAHKFLQSSSKNLTTNVSQRAALAASSSLAAYDQVAGLYDSVFGRSTPPNAAFAYSYLRIFGSLPMEKRATAFNQGLDVKISSLSQNQMASVRSILSMPYNYLIHRDDLGRQWVRSSATDGKAPLQLWWDEPPQGGRFQVYIKRDTGYVTVTNEGKMSPAVDPEYVGTSVALQDNNIDKFKIDTTQIAIVQREAVFLQLVFDNGYMTRSIISNPVNKKALKFIPWADAPSDFHERYKVGLEKARKLFTPDN